MINKTETSPQYFSTEPKSSNQSISIIYKIIKATLMDGFNLLRIYFVNIIQLELLQLLLQVQLLLQLRKELQQTLPCGA